MAGAQHFLQRVSEERIVGSWVTLAAIGCGALALAGSQGALGTCARFLRHPRVLADLTKSATSPHIEFEVAEQCLAHVVGNSASQSYNRSNMLERRRPVMSAWANFVTEQADDKVVPLRARGGQ
jgi:hypothetical protein